MIKVQCPVTTCRVENDAQAIICIGCHTPLQEYTRLLFYPSQLFNAGLAAARDRRLKQARDLFASVVQWCPRDIEARNALAMACFALKDWSEARRQWGIVQTQSPDDLIAQRGQIALADWERRTASATIARKDKKKARPIRVKLSHPKGGKKRRKRDKRLAI
ncbi:MAG: hypothetical protein ACRDHZ_23355 [Ktedonobacteraceae bacterium]